MKNHLSTNCKTHYNHIGQEGKTRNFCFFDDQLVGRWFFYPNDSLEYF
jgi:hypothetical protein